MAVEREDAPTQLDRKFSEYPYRGYKLSDLKHIWTERARALFADKKGDLFVIKIAKADYVAQPVLGSDEIDSPIWVPRFNLVTGAVYITRWNDKVSITPKNAEDYLPIGGSKYHRAKDLGSLPKSWQISELVPQEHPRGLPSGQRQQDIIRADYRPVTGVEYQRVEAMLVGLSRISNEYEQGRIKTDEDLERVAKQTEEMLEDEGLLTARGTLWLDLWDFAKRAVEKDSKGRRNPPRAIMLEAAALARASRRGEKIRRVREKAKNVWEYLDSESKKNVGHIKNAALTLDKIAGLENYRGVYAFREKKDKLSLPEAVSLSEINRGIVENDLERVQAAPWLIHARAAQALLTGTYYLTNKEEDLLKQILEAGGEIGLLRNHSTEYYLKHRQTRGAWRKTAEAYQKLMGALENPDYFETTVFD